MNAVFEAINEVTLAETAAGAETVRSPRPKAVQRLTAVARPYAKLKMAGLSWLVLYPMVTLLIVATAPVLNDAPIYVRTLIASAVMVPVMTWLIQPRLARAVGLAPRPIPKAPPDYCL